jgi:hypothetical protein
MNVREFIDKIDAGRRAATLVLQRLDLGLHEFHHSGFIEGRHQDAAQFGDGAHALGLIGRLAVEPGMMNGDGGLVGQFGQERLMPGHERARGAVSRPTTPQGCPLGGGGDRHVADEALLLG